MVGASEYHERTKHTPESVGAGGRGLDFDNKPRPFKRYRDLPARSLPGFRAVARPALDVVRTPTADGAAGRGPDAADLAQCCYLAGGVTKRIERRGRALLYRAAACTGALYHVDLYAVCGDLPGLDAGVYHFDPRSFALDVVREGDYRGVLARAAGGHDRVARAPVTFVATSTWWRNAWKYRERTFRHAFWDSGTVLANLLATAHGLDLAAEVVAGYADDPVAALLGVDPEREAPLELVPVGEGDEVPAPPAVPPIDPETEPLSPNERSFPLIHEAWRAGTLPDGDAAAAWRERAAPTGTRGPSGGGRTGDGPRIALDPVDAATASKRPLYDTVRRRGSSREYERSPIGFRTFSTVFDRATRGVPLDVRDADGPALAYNDCYLLVNGVDGVEPGTYHYHPDDGELELLRAGECRREAGHLALDQRLGADAAVCAYFATDLDAVTDRFGDRGYRVAQFEAAATAGRLYLAAYAHRDLGATGLTFYDDLVTEWLSPQAAGQTPMFLWTLGRPG